MIPGTISGKATGATTTVSLAKIPVKVTASSPVLKATVPKPVAVSPVSRAVTTGLAAASPVRQSTAQFPAGVTVPLKPGTPTKAVVAQLRVVTTAASGTTAATTAVKAPVQAQAVVQGQQVAASALTAQGLTLIRTPVQLPPGVQATMITNAQGVPVMRLQGPGIQSSSPVTIMTTQVGTSGLQGAAAFVRVATPISGASTTAAGSTLIKLPIQTATTQAVGTIKIPVTGATQITSSTAGMVTGQAVIQQQLPISMTPGSQVNVLGPQGQITAVGPGGIPVKIALGNVQAQHAHAGAQIQQVVKPQVSTAAKPLVNASPVKISAVTPTKTLVSATAPTGTPGKVAQAILATPEKVTTPEKVLTKPTLTPQTSASTTVSSAALTLPQKVEQVTVNSTAPGTASVNSTQTCAAQAVTKLAVTPSTQQNVVVQIPATLTVKSQQEESKISAQVALPAQAVKPVSVPVLAAACVPQSPTPMTTATSTPNKQLTQVTPATSAAVKTSSISVVPLPAAASTVAMAAVKTPVTVLTGTIPTATVSTTSLQHKAAVSSVHSLVSTGVTMAGVGIPPGNYVSSNMLSIEDKRLQN